MLINFLLTSLLIIGFVSLARNRHTLRAFAALFYAIQIMFAFWIGLSQIDATEITFFTFDRLGVLFYSMMTVIAAIVFYQGDRYLDTESLREYRLYNISFMVLCLSLTGVYFSNNLAVTWIFLEATTIATAGLVYHRRNLRSLEATWKYIFVCSVGIAIAYLGILFLSTVVAESGDLSYRNLAALISQGNTIYLKLAFLFIFIGYSCKMELFPLFTIGVDANYVTPTPAAAFISTALVNAGFVAFFRVFKVFEVSPIFAWASQVLILAGLLSLLIAAIYLRRTHNFKRFLAYSTVENLGIVAIGLGLSGIGTLAALLHIVVHTLLKSGMFLQMAQIGRFYRTYRISRISGYFRANPLGGAIVFLGFMALMALPPSGLFISEYMILKQMIVEGRWFVLVTFTLIICLIMYTLCQRMLTLCYRPSKIISIGEINSSDKVAMWLQMSLIVMAMLLGVWRPEQLMTFLESIVYAV